MRDLIVLQSLWVMERRHTDGFERSLEENVRMIVDAGFGGVSADCTNRANVARLAGPIDGAELIIEGQAFPKTVDDLEPVLEIAAESMFITSTFNRMFAHDGWVDLFLDWWEYGFRSFRRWASSSALAATSARYDFARHNRCGVSFSYPSEEKLAISNVWPQGVLR
jgi:hypothetical protein